MKLSALPAALQRQIRATHAIPKSAGRVQAIESKAADLFAFQLRAYHFTGWDREYVFALQDMGRKWRFDFAHAELRLAVEVEGLRIQTIGGKKVCTGRHSTPDGYRDDCRKYNAAVQLGWHVLRFDQKLITSGEAIATLHEVLTLRGWKSGAPNLATIARAVATRPRVQRRGAR